MVLIGKKRHYVEVQASTRTSDGQGGWTNVWAKISKEWMQAIPTSQSRTLDAGGIKYAIAVEFTANKFSGYTITNAHRLLWDGQYFTIYSIVPSPKLDEIKITAYA